MTKADKEGQRKAPILRFKGFTDDWEQRKLKNLITEPLSYGLSVSSKEYDGIHKYLRITDIDEKSRKFNKDKLTSPDIKFNSSSKKYLLSNNDIVFARTGASTGKTYMYQKEDGIVYYAGFLIKASLSSNFDNNFIFQQTYRKRYYQRVKVISQRSGQPGINSKEYGNFDFLITQIEEQNKIGKLFKIFDNLLALYEKKKQLLTQLKQGIVNFLITKNGQKSQLRFSGFNNNWESKSFEKLLNYEQPTKYIVKKADYISQGTPVLTANKSFILGYTNENNVYQNIPAIIFDDFTLESKYVDFPFMVKSSAIKILTSKNSNLFFIYQLLNNQRFVQEGHSRHYISVVQKKKILVPSIQEQNKIGNLIKQLENNIEQNSDTIALLKSLKEFLLQNIFL